MADNGLKDKKTKLASTRKRFKELQELKRQKEASASPTPSVERLSMSPSLPQSQSINNVLNYENNINSLQQNTQSQQDSQPSQYFENSQQQSCQNDIFYNNDAYNTKTPFYSNGQSSTTSNTSLPNYFGDQNSVDFFDNVSSNTNNILTSAQQNLPQNTYEAQNKEQNNALQKCSTLLTYFDTTESENPTENTDQNIGLAKYFDNSSPNFENVPSQQFQPEKAEIQNYALFPAERKQSYVSEMQHITHPHYSDGSTEEDPAIIHENVENFEEDTQTLSKNMPLNVDVEKSSPDLIHEFPILQETTPSQTEEILNLTTNGHLNVEQCSQNNQGYLKKSPVISDLESGIPNAIDYLDDKHLEDITNQEIPTLENNEVITDSSVSAEYPEISQNDVLLNINLPDCYLNQETFSQSESDVIKDQINRTTDLAKGEVQYSNVENLKQLSNQLAQMIDPSYEFAASGGVTDLEKRNLELASNLEKEKLNSEKLKCQNQEYIARINDLEVRLRQDTIGTELQNQQEIQRLKDELQNHFQTIGLLVAEKTELSALVNDYELTLKQKNSECGELQARLKASRSRVADLERETGRLKEEKSKIENLGGQYSSSYDTLKKEYESLKEQKDELTQDLLETKERLKQTLDENVVSQQKIKDLTGKISLADIKIQQLTSSDNLLGVNSQFEQLTKQKLALESDLANLNQMLKSFIKERDDARTEYQHYAEQLNAQITNMHATIEKLQQEKETLINQEQNRIRHIGELERQLQTLQDNYVAYSSRNTSNSDLKAELESYREMVIQLESQKTANEENYTKVCNEKELLLKELEAKTDSISQLESMVEQLRGNQPDSVKLLATMESDKVAAARAVQQNKELKSQMESMQEVFTKLDNDKIVLTDQLNYEQTTNKELMEKLQKTEIHLQTLADAIEIKDKELLHLRNSFEEINRQALQHNQLEDRLRHYEAHDHSAHSLQNELLEAKTTIAKMTNELNQLRNIEANWDNQNKNEHDENTEKTLVPVGDNNTIIELNNEINKLKAELTRYQIENGRKDSVPKLENLQLKEPIQNKEISDSNLLQSDANQNKLDKETTVKFLEEKVKKTMQEIADLTDEKQKLEHIILQLQGETETIGEYVALYQHQRMILKQKALEKDYQLKQLASDREQIKGKLDRLNQLIQKLVLEKGVIPEELIRHQQNMNNLASNLCEMHSQMNDEVNSRIAQEKDATFNKENIENSSTNPDDQATKTAEEIITLLSEIKTSNLVEPEDSFHHCPYCSGQLITV